MDPAGGAAAQPLAEVAVGQRVWVRLSADASRAHGPALLMRLLADSHPDAAAAASVAATGSALTCDASAAVSAMAPRSSASDRRTGTASAGAPSGTTVATAADGEGSEDDHGLDELFARSPAPQPKLQPKAPASASRGVHDTHSAADAALPGASSGTAVPAGSTLQQKQSDPAHNNRSTTAAMPAGGSQQKPQQNQQLKTGPVRSIAEVVASALRQAMSRHAHGGAGREPAATEEGLSCDLKLRSHARLPLKAPQKLPPAAITAQVHSANPLTICARYNCLISGAAELCYEARLSAGPTRMMPAPSLARTSPSDRSRCEPEYRP